MVGMVVVSCDKRSPMDCLNCDQPCVRAGIVEAVEAEERGVEVRVSPPPVRKRLMGYYGIVQALLAMSGREEEEEEMDDYGIGVDDGRK